MVYLFMLKNIALRLTVMLLTAQTNNKVREDSKIQEQ